MSAASKVAGAHYFADKNDLLNSLIADLVTRFRDRTHSFESETDPLDAYVSGALALGATADTVAARCWVGVFAEAVRSPALFEQTRRLLEAEMQTICRRSGARLDEHGSGAVRCSPLSSARLFSAHLPRARQRDLQPQRCDCWSKR